MRTALVLLALAAPLAAQDPPHVHGGYAACYDLADWTAQQQAYEARALERWNEIIGPLIERGACWLTEDGAIYNVRESDVEGAAMIQSPLLEKMAKRDPPRWAFVSLAALEDS